MNYTRLELIPTKKEEKKEERIEIDENRTVEFTGYDKHRFATKDGGCVGLHVFVRGEFEGSAIFLSRSYDWALGKDSSGEVILVPLKRI